MGTMNRAQRRTAKRQAPKKKQIAHNLSKDEIAQRIVRNGITLDDLQKNYNFGFKDGYECAGEDVVKGCYAAICLVLHERLHFGKQRCYDFLSDVDLAVRSRITGQDLIQQAFDEVGVTIDFEAEPLENRIEMKE